jgi:hypothetical protein
VIKTEVKSKFSATIALTILVSLPFTSIQAKGICSTALSFLSPRNIGHLFKVKNPIPAHGDQKLFPDHVIHQTTHAHPSPTDIEGLADKVLDYAKLLYRWRFITKAEYDSYVFNIGALSQLPEKVRSDSTHTHREEAIASPDSIFFEAGNPFYPSNANELFKKPASEVRVDDFISVIDSGWNKSERTIRRSPDIYVLHPTWRKTGTVLGQSARGLGIVLGASLAWAVLNSLNDSIKGQVSAETTRLSYEQRAKATFDNFRGASPKVREGLQNFFIRKHGMFSWLHSEARDELVQADMYLMLVEGRLEKAAENEDKARIAVLLYALFEFEGRFADVLEDPAGANMKTRLDEIHATYDPTGAIRKSFKTQYPELNNRPQ